MRKFPSRATLLASICCLVILSAGDWLSAQTRTGNTGGTSRAGGTGGSTRATTQAGGGGRTGGAAAGNRTGTGAAGQEVGAIDTAAGTSASINREFGTGMIGASDTQGVFIGNELAGTQRTIQQVPNFQQRQNGNVQGGKPTRESKVRPTLSIGFEVPGKAIAAPNTNILVPQQELTQRLNSNAQFSGLNVALQEQGRVVLRGSVDSDRDKRLAEAYLRLYPGVREIDNQLTVVPTE